MNKNAPLLEAQTSFTLDLLREIINQKPEPFTCSPFSISVSLAILYAGARAETRDEIGRLLLSKFEIKEDRLHSYFVGLLKEFSSQDDKFCLDTANKVWIREGLTLLPSYLDLIDRTYNGNLQQADFEEREELCKEVNDWFKENTHNLIKEILTQEDVTEESMMFILNAIYFKGKWLHEFKAKATVEDDFKINTRKRKKVEYLRKSTATEHFNYCQDNDFQVLRMAYKGDRVACYVFLPKKILSANEILENLDGSRVFSLLRNTKNSKQAKHERYIEISYPKFEIESEHDLNKILPALGMESAFDPSKADFSGMTLWKELSLDKAVQKAYIKMDEEGTEAAAVTRTAPATGGSIDPAYWVEFSADHPFFYFIVHDPTMTILFAGIYT